MRKLILTAIVLASQLTLALPRGHVAADTPARRQCFVSCVDCSQRCKRDKQCIQTCYQMKRACCQSGGLGPGPNKTCSCS